MAAVIPSNVQAPGDLGHTVVVHNNIADMLSLLTQVLSQAGEVPTTVNSSAVAAVQALLAANAGPGLLPRPRLYAPQHLRRWRAAFALATSSVVPVVVAGDSIAQGIGSDNTTSTSNSVCVTSGFVAQLRQMFGFAPRTYQQNPGEGFIFADDARITTAGSPSSQQWACVPLGHGYRLIGATQTLTFTVPAGVTSVAVIQANQTAAFSAGNTDLTGQYNINGGGNISLTALTNTGLPVVTTVAVTAGQAFQVIGPATHQTYIQGFILSSAATNGVQCHRVAAGGLVSGSLLGSQASGVLTATAPNQVFAAQAVYKWCPVPGIIMVEFCVNDQQFQNGGGSAGQNGVTQALYLAWITQFCAQAVTDGWCVLLLGTTRDVGYAPGYPTVDQYLAVLKNLALTTDHVAFLDCGEIWGGYTLSQADGVQVASSVHPNLAGHGDMAALLYDTLLGRAHSGITELTAG